MLPLLPPCCARPAAFEAWLQLFFGDIAALRYSQTLAKLPNAADESFWVRSGKEFKRAHNLQVMLPKTRHHSRLNAVQSLANTHISLRHVPEITSALLYAVACCRSQQKCRKAKISGGAMLGVVRET